MSGAVVFFGKSLARKYLFVQYTNQADHSMTLLPRMPGLPYALNSRHQRPTIAIYAVLAIDRSTSNMLSIITATATVTKLCIRRRKNFCGIFMNTMAHRNHNYFKTTQFWNRISQETKVLRSSLLHLTKSCKAVALVTLVGPSSIPSLPSKLDTRLPVQLVIYDHLLRRNKNRPEAHGNRPRHSASVLGVPTRLQQARGQSRSEA